jgi:hypothetical protein
MTFSLLPPPVSDAVSFPHDCINLARAVLGGYACARCRAGLCEHGSELCIRCIEQAERIQESAEAFWRELRAR